MSTSDFHFKRARKILVFHDVESLSVQVSPAGWVVLLGVEEAGGVQLTAHERGGALIACDLLSALRPRVTVQPASCSKTTLSKQAWSVSSSSQNSQGKLTMVMCIFPTRPFSLPLSVLLSVSVSSQRWTHLRLGVIAQVILTSCCIRTAWKAEIRKMKAGCSEDRQW